VKKILPKIFFTNELSKVKRVENGKSKSTCETACRGMGLDLGPPQLARIHVPNRVGVNYYWGQGIRIWESLADVRHKGGLLWCFEYS